MNFLTLPFAHLQQKTESLDGSVRSLSRLSGAVSLVEIANGSVRSLSRLSGTASLVEIANGSMRSLSRVSGTSLLVDGIVLGQMSSHGGASGHAQQLILASGAARSGGRVLGGLAQNVAASGAVRSRSGVSGYASDSAFHPDTVNLRDRIIAAGSTISESHLSAVNDFVEGCYADGTRSAIKDCGLFVGDSLTGALQKLWYVNTSTLTNFSFVEGDYTLTGGLSSVAANKYLLTEESTSSLSIPSDNSHLSFFSIAGNPVGAFREIGVRDSDDFQLIISFNGESYYRSHVAGSAIEAAPSPGTIGYFIGSTGSTGSYIHRNGTEYVSNANTGWGATTTNLISVFRALNYSQKASTGYTIGNHLTSAQAILLNNRFQSLKTALGR